MIARYVNPWKFKREQEEQKRMLALRQRDGDNCSRCRRPMRFDLTPGADLGPKVEHVLHLVNGGTSEFDNLCLTHGRCNAAGSDHTPEVTERVRRKNEAELFAKSRRARRRA